MQQDKKEILSLRELAAVLNVATSTVSRALAGDTGVGKEKAEEVRKLAAEYGYRPKPLRRKIARAVGLVIATNNDVGPDDAYQSLLIMEVASALAEIGWHFHVELVARNANQHELPKVLAENRVDGVLLSGFPDVAFCQMLLKEKIPAVVLDDYVERTRLSSVISEVASRTQSIVEHLIEIGHERIGFVFTELNYPTVKGRYEGYLKALQKCHDSVEKKYQIKVAASTLQQGIVAVRQLLEIKAPPTAIVFLTDLLAIGGLIALSQAGLRVPEDVSIVGHDNSYLGRDLDPPLTSVDMDVANVVKTSLKLLQKQIRFGVFADPVQKVISSKVVWRGSCGPIPLIGER